MRLAADASGSFFEDWKNGGQACYGHRSTDVQPFKNLWDDDFHFYTNKVGLWGERGGGGGASGHDWSFEGWVSD
jgi:hypothetical protein